MQYIDIYTLINGSYHREARVWEDGRTESFLAKDEGDTPYNVITRRIAEGTYSDDLIRTIEKRWNGMLSGTVRGEDDRA